MKFIVFGIIVVLTLAFLACAIIYPELVGIAGSKAKEIEASHRPDDEQNGTEPHDSV